MRILIINYGNPREVCDSFGPLLGSLLSTEEFVDEVKVIGTCIEPIHTFKHFLATLDIIKQDWDMVITTDAAMSPDDDKGKLIIRHGGVHPGRGTDKKDHTDYVGDIGIIYCVGEKPLEKPPLQSDVSGAALQAIEEIHNLIYRLSCETLQLITR